jgi:hypothetical protein
MLQITNPTQLRRYTNGVRQRAEHHGPKVDAIWPALLGYVQVYADHTGFKTRRSPSDRFTYANQVWAKFNGRRLSFSYNHANMIVAREGRQVLAQFDNTTTVVALKQFFENL